MSRAERNEVILSLIGLTILLIGHALIWNADKLSNGTVVVLPPVEKVSPKDG